MIKKIFWASPSFLRSRRGTEKGSWHWRESSHSRSLGCVQASFLSSWQWVIVGLSDERHATKGGLWTEDYRIWWLREGLCALGSSRLFPAQEVYLTNTAVLQTCKDNVQDFSAVSHTTLWLLLKSMGFKYKKRSGRRCIHERADVVLKHHQYLCDMGGWGSMGLPSSFSTRRRWTNIKPAPVHGRTPPTSELNPVELIRIRPPIKERLQRETKPPPQRCGAELTGEAIEYVSPEKWPKACDHVCREEDDYLRSNGLIDDMNRALVIHVGEQNESDFTDSDDSAVNSYPENCKTRNVILISVLFVVFLVSIFRERYLGWNGANKNLVTIFSRKCSQKFNCFLFWNRL